MQNPFEIIIERLNSIERHLLNNANKAFAAQPEADTLLTIKQAANLLHLAVPTLYSKVSRKEIPHSKNGKRLYFSKADLIEWVKQGKQSSPDEIRQNVDKHLQQVAKRK